ncbi:ribose-phosphate diphosphokinase [Methermicoccus shengliensis]|uniref:Ribose-phosphate pyrophosphokinase n=1 Tax=Methermicoccus shengliensis TaxID=660064 RepID=A0A832VY32_9EURY|nr:ribose-phosphate diphosphokinase [Methermicoccus shengliensis]KUK04121.1 MAG: Ribose-phosphate pyrophosphokinase [Euryarchaeota archaeon 55_53]KUK29965.1 MAG: Ribose-phosphate pyrophosphokinase [Methanosarcinales archeaon 56_1174]MDI3487981.1 ribose-phosphate pyrophosphokinae [Methanosarcinales archaeon]MDN5295577.1 ribose-phosphate pyrophosphokinae [Methanosarcinales archaeon]HIH70368.1 ribose-phosphate diphosphokinase [Methermicoccus shengliensis]
MRVVAGPSSQMLAAKVARAGGFSMVPAEYERFPDGEGYLRVCEDVAGDDVAIVQTIGCDCDLVSLLQLIDACEDAARLVAVIPYMGYARQDRRFKQGEPISARAVARCIGADHVVLVNVHNERVLDYFVCDVCCLDAAPVLAGHIVQMGLDDPLFVAPDDGAIEIARAAAQAVGAQHDHLEKKRLSPEHVEMAPKHLDVEGRHVVLIDDIISTGGTMTTAIGMLTEQGASRVYVACVHPVFVKNAIVRLFAAGAGDIVFTDTIEGRGGVVSVAPLIARHLREMR